MSAWRDTKPYQSRSAGKALMPAASSSAIVHHVCLKFLSLKAINLALPTFEYMTQPASRTSVTILGGLMDEWWELDCLVSKNATECKKSFVGSDILPPCLTRSSMLAI